MNTPLPEIEIFRAGHHVALSGEALSFGDVEVAGTAAAYQPNQHEAPVCIGHPRHDAPAYGWVAGLRAEGGRLLARLVDLDPGFAELVRAGRFKKVSAAFYRPDAVGNPTPGAWALRHVGFLGAAPPAVKGLKPVQFGAAEAGVVTFSDAYDAKSFAGSPSVSRAFGGPAAASPFTESAKIQEETVIDASKLSAGPPPPSDVADPAELDRRAREIEAREVAFAEREKSARRQQDATDVAVLVAEGRVLAAEQEDLVAFLDGLAGDGPDTTAAFADARVTSPRAFFKAFLAGLPKRVEFREIAGGDTDVQTISFSAPPGFAIDPAGAELHAKALAYRRNHPNADYVAAVQAVGGR